MPVVPTTLTMSAITADAVSIAAGARALERDLADRVALEHDRVERALDRRRAGGGGRRATGRRGRRPRPSSERRRADEPHHHVQSHAPRRRAPGVIALDPDVVDVVERDARAERDGREDRHLRSGVRAGDVLGRIRLGVARAAAPRRARRRSVSPASIWVRMKFVVPFTIPSTRWTFVTTSASRSTLITGIAAQTLRLEAQLHAGARTRRRRARRRGARRAACSR